MTDFVRTVGYFEGKVYHSGRRMYERRRDRSYFIIENGKRIDVALINGHGTVIKLKAAKPGGEHDACITATLKKAIEKCERQRMPEGSDAKPWEVDDNMVWNNGVTKCVDAIKELMPASDESNQPKEPLWPQAQTKS